MGLDFRAFYLLRERKCTFPYLPITSSLFAFFVNIYGLKTPVIISIIVNNILTFSFWEWLKNWRGRERMNRLSFLSVDFLIVSASAIRMSADRIRKPIDTIRMQTSRVRVFLNEKEERSGPFVLLSGALEEFFGRIGQTACSTKEKNQQKARKYAF